MTAVGVIPLHPCPKCQGTGWVTRADPDGYAWADRCPNGCPAPQYTPGAPTDEGRAERLRSAAAEIERDAPAWAARMRREAGQMDAHGEVT